jgi:hypothetical protein
MNALLRPIASGDWLTPARARQAARAIACLVLGALLILATLLLQQALLQPRALPPATDFDAYWAAARLASAGHPAAAYDNHRIEITERAATDMPPGYLAFYYPPTFLLLILPLGWLGYVPALFAFLAAESVLLLAALRRLLPWRWAWLPLLTWPGFLMNGLSGQNAPLSAAGFAAAALWLDRRPALAGASLGLLACKPQLAVCVPVALAAARRWRALAACAATAASLALAAWLAFGTAVWRGFLANAPNARADIETIAIKWPKMQSLFGAIRLAGGGNATAYAAQGLVSAAAVALLVAVAARRPGARLEAATLATAALLFTPFLYDYDLLLLAVPMACLTLLAQANGAREGSWLPWEKSLLALAFVLPLAARPAGLLLGVIIAPPAIAALLLLLARRAGIFSRRQVQPAC